MSKEADTVVLQYSNLASEIANTLKLLDDKRVETKNEDNIEVANMINYIGSLYASYGDSVNELKFHKESLEMYKRLYKTDHPGIATSLNNLGLAYRSNGDFASELKCHLEALEMYRRIHKNADHTDIATSLSNVGLAYRSNLDHVNELKYQKEALEVTNKNLTFKLNLRSIKKYIYFFKMNFLLLIKSIFD